MPNDVCCMLPDQSLKQMMAERAWEKFHRDILNRGSSIDKVIDVAQKGAESIIEDKFELWDDTFSSGYGVKKQAIFTHLLNHIIKQYRENFVSDPHDKQEVNRFVWNTANNLIRCLKRIKNDEAPFLLPYEDKKQTLEFIESLKCPPPEYNSNNPYM